VATGAFAARMVCNPEVARARGWRNIPISHVLLKGMSRDILDPSPEAVKGSRGIQPLSTLAELFVLTRFWSAAVKAADQGGSRYPCGFIAALWAAHHSSFPKLTSVNGLRKLATMVLSETRGL
jgi:hypothetical protein